MFTVFEYKLHGYIMIIFKAGLRAQDVKTSTQSLFKIAFLSSQSASQIKQSPVEIPVMANGKDNFQNVSSNWKNKYLSTVVVEK